LAGLISNEEALSQINIEKEVEMDIFGAMREAGLDCVRITRGIEPSYKLAQEALRILEETGEYDHEEVAFFFDERTGLKSIIAIHDSTLGKALQEGEPDISLGGTRILDYIKPKEREEGMIVPREVIIRRAVFDVLRLSRGMTRKSSITGLNLGGAKGVIIADPDKEKRPVLLHQYGKCVDTFGGRFITGEDENVKIPDADIMSFVTPYVAGLSPDNPRRKGSGDPSPWTAQGVFQSMKAVLEEIYGTDSFRNITIAIQGIAGNVGSNLARLLHEAGAKLIGSGGRHIERTEAVCKELGAEMLEDRERIYDVECDIFSPNAGGATLNDETIPRLKCKAIVGAANNQLLKPKHGDALHNRGIIYVTDYAGNAGGVTNVYVELVEGGYNPELVAQIVNNIYNTTKEMIRVSREKNLPTYLVTDEIADERVRRGIINTKIPKVVLN
jgi:leucine dehydrogenase